VQTEIAQIVEVDVVGGTPTGTYKVKLMTGATVEHVPQLLPMAATRLSKGAGTSNRLQGGSGMLPIAPRGSWCLVTQVGSSGSGRGQTFILGFFAPRKDGAGSTMESRKRIQPGGFDLRTPFGSGVSLHADGGIEIQADSACERLMTPLSEGAPDTQQALIADLCRNFAMNTAAGQVRFGEISKGKSGYHAKIYELSRWSASVLRQAKNWASSGVNPETGSDADLASGGQDRYVEIEYGTASGGGIYREKFVGSKSVELACDGQGGWTFVADESCSHKVGALISVEESSSGTRAIQANEMTYTVVGKVTWTVLEFEVQASMVSVTGVVRFNSGARQGARVLDLVKTGSSIGHIITGDPLFMH